MELCWLFYIMQALGGHITLPFSSYQSVLQAMKGQYLGIKTEKKRDVSGCRIGYLISVFKQRILMEYVNEEVGLG